MKQIKFQLLYKGMPYSPENQERPWFKKVYSLGELIATPIEKLSDVHSFSELVAKRQFTGLQDINGVEIYEGDIIKDDYGSICAVEFREGCFVVDVDIEFVLCALDDIEVIGNIHQNPELLS